MLIPGDRKETKNPKNKQLVPNVELVNPGSKERLNMLYLIFYCLAEAFSFRCIPINEEMTILAVLRIDYVIFLFIEMKQMATPTVFPIRRIGRSKVQPDQLHFQLYSFSVRYCSTHFIENLEKYVSYTKMVEQFLNMNHKENVVKAYNDKNHC